MTARECLSADRSAPPLRRDDGTGPFGLSGCDTIGTTVGPKHNSPTSAGIYAVCFQQ